MKDRLDTFITETNTAFAGVHEPLQGVFPKLRDGMTNVSQRLGNVEDGVQVTTRSIFLGFQDNHQNMVELMDMVSRSTAQSVESASLMRRDFSRMQKQLLEIGCILGANEPYTAFNSSSVALNRLASKPSALKDAYDKFQQLAADQAGHSRSFEQHTYQQHSDLVVGSQISCYCQKNTVIQQQMKGFGGFHFYKKTTTSQRHLPGCAFAQQNTIATEKARKAVYTGLRGILSVALELSISWKSGAGGFSISPNVTIRPMVDEAKSPVFRVMTLMRERAYHLLKIEPPAEETKGVLVVQVLRHATATIIKLYRTRICSVYDVNVRGESALHQWTNVSVKV